MQFKSDSDRRAWRDYAAAAIRIFRSGDLVEEAIAARAATIADAMLEEERSRRPTAIGWREKRERLDDARE